MEETDYNNLSLKSNFNADGDNINQDNLIQKIAPKAKYHSFHWETFSMRLVLA